MEDDLRKCLREPIPELWWAAKLLDAAVAAIGSASESWRNS
jgi:hypothetical protein